MEGHGLYPTEKYPIYTALNKYFHISVFIKINWPVLNTILIDREYFRHGLSSLKIHQLITENILNSESSNKSKEENEALYLNLDGILFSYNEPTPTLFGKNECFTECWRNIYIMKMQSSYTRYADDLAAFQLHNELIKRNKLDDIISVLDGVTQETLESLSNRDKFCDLIFITRKDRHELSDILKRAKNYGRLR